MIRRTARVGLLTTLVALVAVLGCVPQVPGTPSMPPIQPPLTNTTWNLEALGQPGNMRSALVNREVTLSFINDSQATGSAGCNSYGAQYVSAIDGAISFTDIISTEMYCVEPGVMDQEQFFLETLRVADQYEYVTGSLHISGGGRLLVLSRD